MKLRFLLPSAALLFVIADTARAVPIDIYNDPFSASNFGISIATIGDINGDLRTDFAIGIPSGTYSGAQYYDGGAIFLYHAGENSVVNVLGQNWSWYLHDRFGERLAGLGDTNGDGSYELAISDPGYWLDSGYVTVRSIETNGETSSLFNFDLGGRDYGDEFGSELANVGDVNGDGINDLVVAALHANKYEGTSLYKTDTGTVTLYSGSDLSLIRVFYGENTGDRFGAGLGGGADIDNDGTPDLVIGAPGWDESPTKQNRGKVYAYRSNGSLIFSKSWDQSGKEFGSSVAMAGNADDLNGTGSEVIVGIPLANSNDGKAVIYNSTGGVVATLNGLHKFGTKVYGNFDLNNDGRPEVGVYRNADNGKGRFQAYSRNSQSGAWEVVFDETGTSGEQQLGISMALGYFNDAAVRDIALGAPGSQFVQTYEPGLISGIVTQYGAGTEGAAVNVVGNPAPGQSVNLAIETGMGAATGLVFFSTNYAPEPFTPSFTSNEECEWLLGENLLPFTIPLAFNGTGEVNLNFPLPVDMAEGDVFLQAFGKRIEPDGSETFFCTPGLKLGIHG